jgi:hypothetical protein
VEKFGLLCRFGATRLSEITSVRDRQTSRTETAKQPKFIGSSALNPSWFASHRSCDRANAPTVRLDKAEISSKTLNFKSNLYHPKS